MVENPKTASSSMREALRLFKRGERHRPVWGDKSRIRGVFVRNPFDRLVSGYFYNEHRARIGFHEWLTGQPWAVHGMDIKRVPQTAWAWGCTHVFRFEELESEWGRWLKTASLPSCELPRLNAGKERPHYRDFIDDASRAIIEDRFYPDFAAWGYRW